MKKLMLKTSALLEESKSLVEYVTNRELVIPRVFMYNLSVPSILKAFIDTIMIAGQNLASPENVRDKAIAKATEQVVQAAVTLGLKRIAI